ncbi:MAG: GDSL-type esterase/lipase family protein [Planctomycetota bacterium]
MRRLQLLVPLVSLPVLCAQQVRWLDLEGDTARQVTVHRVPRQYLGHPTTVLLEDGRTMLCVHPNGHGRGAIVLQRSGDGGHTWSEPLPVPENWATSQETPTIHRLIDPRTQQKRLVLFSGLHPIRRAVSADDGITWTPLEPIGDFGGIVAMASVVRRRDGSYAAFFHDDGRYLHEHGERASFTVFQTRSTDGGLSWSAPAPTMSAPGMDLCEPGIVRSPDGGRLAMLLRENSRRHPAQIAFSDDEGDHWSQPMAMPDVLCGDRHVAAYAPDGRLLISFRDMWKQSPTYGDWVAWVGTFDDLLYGGQGQYRVRLSRNWRGSDCAYPGVEVLPDGTFVLTTYGHWEPGEEPFIRCVHLRLSELDERAAQPPPTFARGPGTARPTPRVEDWWQKRVVDDLAAARAGGHEVVFLGDSITQGFGGDGSATWAREFVPRHAINLGVSGDRTQNVLWRLDHGLIDELACLRNTIAVNHVGVCVVMIGTNNATKGECTPAEIADGVAAVTQRLLDGLPKAEVLLLAIFPRGGPGDAAARRCAEANALLAQRFAGHPRVHWKDIGRAFLSPDGTLSKDTMPDLLHLSPAAYRTWADQIVGDVDRLLGR